MRRITELGIAKIMLLGVVITCIAVICGGVFCLINDGNMDIYSLYYAAALHIITWPQTWILFGIWVLIITQPVRIFATACLFLQRKEMVLFAVSLLVLIMLLCSIFVAPLLK